MSDTRLPALGVAERLKKALSRHPDQPLHFFAALTGYVGGGAVAVEPVDIRAHVDAHHVAFADLPGAGDPVDHLLVDGDTHAGGVAVVMEE